MRYRAKLFSVGVAVALLTGWAGDAQSQSRPVREGQPTQPWAKTGMDLATRMRALGQAYRAIQRGEADPNSSRLQAIIDPEWEGVTFLDENGKPVKHDRRELLFRAVWKIKGIAQDLWWTTGRCEFVEIPPRAIRERACEIAARYEKYIRANARRGLKDILLENLPRNVDHLKTGYCWMAFLVIEHHVFLPSDAGAYMHVCPGGPIDVRIGRADREAIWEFFVKWLDANRGDLVWHAGLGKIWNGMWSSQLPKEFFKHFRHSPDYEEDPWRPVMPPATSTRPATRPSGLPGPPEGRRQAPAKKR